MALSTGTAEWANRKQSNYQEGNPYWNLGGRDNDAKSYAYDAYMRIFGRAPTETELAQAVPVYQQGDRNIGNVGMGDQYVASLYKAQNGQIDQQKQLDEKVPQYAGGINDIYQELVKRGATPDEIQHFGREMASGNLDAFTLRQFVQSMPEYQTAQDTAFRTGLETELRGNDTKLFDQNKDNIISRYASMGRTGSTSLDYALTDMLGKIADKRGEWLANLSASQYGGNKDAARSDYTSSVNKMLSDEEYQRQQNDALSKRGWDVADYTAKADDFSRFNKPKQPGWADYVGLALNGANTAAQTGKNFGFWGA